MSSTSARFAGGQLPTLFGKIFSKLLTSTFIHIPGISDEEEKRLWSQGARTWGDFLASPSRWKLENLCFKTAERVLKNSHLRLSMRDIHYFARKLPRKEIWRVFHEFESDVAYLDIETDGGFYGEVITVIGVYDGQEYQSFIEGINLRDFPEYIETFKAVVTFFGTGFDLPVVNRQFSDVLKKKVHIDLHPLMQRLGQRGGLKKIERRFGIRRSNDTEGLTGRHAVLLWRRHRKGQSGALDLLVQYNKEDVMHLKTLMRIAYENLRRHAMEESLLDSTSPPRVTVEGGLPLL